MSRWLSFMILALCLVTMLAACGGVSAPSTSLKVTTTDFTFTPNTFTVPAGQKISLHLTNNGAVAHSFIIMKAGVEIKSHFEDADSSGVYWQQTPVPPGNSIDAVFTAPSEPGDYQIVCGVHGHFEAGMAAKLVVVAQP